jgi:SAM-dependent methyltransferase
MPQIIDHPTSIPYPATYQRELSPAWLHYAATLCGAVVRNATEPFLYLEVGCGQACSALIHAASYPRGRFHALDRDVVAIASARNRAKALGLTNIEFHAAAFADERLQNLPQFDFIAVHGVYSWVDAAQRKVLRGVLRNRLAPGGVAYVSYNAMPGWAAELPLRRLFVELTRERAAEGAEHIRRAAGEIERLRACEFKYFTAYPTAARALGSWTERDPGYLAHEYLADGWEPLWSVDVIDDMANAGLRHIGSATLWDNHEELLVNPPTSSAIAGLATERLRTLALDLALNRGFRRDLYVRAEAATNEGEKFEAAKNLHVISTGEPRAIPEAIVVPRGRIRFQRAFIALLRGIMQGGARRIGALARDIGAPEAETIRNLLWLTAAGALQPGP